MKKTKIICTMGPNTSDKNIMMELARNGMDVARFNFSHGDYNEHQGRLELLKEVRKELDIPVAALLDTKGPEIRTGQLKDVFCAVPAWMNFHLHGISLRVTLVL